MRYILMRDAFRSNGGIPFGLFEYIQEVGDFEWIGGDESPDPTPFNVAALDMDYFGRSGSKFCSPMVANAATLNNLSWPDDLLLETNRTAIARLLVYKFGDNWNRLWAAQVLSYNPTDTYYMNEQRATQKADGEDETVNDSKTYTGTESTQYGRTETTTHGRTDTTNESVYGFNSSEASPSSVTSETEGGTTSIADSGTDTNTRNLSDARASARHKTVAGSENETISRTGNSGLHTKQQLIESERKLRTWNFFEQVYRDIDSVLTLKYFDPCRV